MSKFGQNINPLRMVFHRWKLYIVRHALHSDKCSLNPNQMHERQMSSPGEYHFKTIRDLLWLLLYWQLIWCHWLAGGSSCDHGSSWHPLHLSTNIFYTKQIIWLFKVRRVWAQQLGCMSTSQLVGTKVCGHLEESVQLSQILVEWKAIRSMSIVAVLFSLHYIVDP